jgi:hypothetical protein
MKRGYMRGVSGQTHEGYVRPLRTATEPSGYPQLLECDLD